MGYLICDKCGGYYELQKGESSEDFENCQCGGNLKYSKSKVEAPSTKSKNKMETNPTETDKKKIQSSYVKQPTDITCYKEPQLEKRFCRECGAENRPDSTFCHRCGKSFSATEEIKKTSRTIELILGILGGIFGLLGGIFAVLFGILASEITGLGISAILASILGIAASVYVLRDAKWGGVILLVSAIWLLISISLFGVIGAVLLGVAGLLALFRK